MSRLIVYALALAALLGASLACQVHPSVAHPSEPNIIASANHYAESIESWEATYVVEWSQPGTTFDGRVLPPTRDVSHVHEIAQGAADWLEQTTSGNQPYSSGHGIEATDGHIVDAIAITGNTGTIEPFRNHPKLGLAPSYSRFLMGVVAHANLPEFSEQDLLSIVNDPRAHVLSEPVTINGHRCRVIQVEIEIPLEGRNVILKTTTQPSPSQASPPTTRIGTRQERYSLALDPALGYMPVRLIKDVAVAMIQPQPFKAGWCESQMILEKALRTEQGVWVPQDATLTEYHDNTHPATITHLHADSVTINRQYPRSQFTLVFPKGCRVGDGVRGIAYTVGDSQVVIRSRLAQAAKDNQFFAGILGKPAPPLKGDQWLVGKPMQLADVKGRSVVLHFWNIACGPCVAEIPVLQEEHGKDDPKAPLFISVLTGGDESDRADIEAFIREKGITFPVLWDAPDPQKQGWGLTSEAYGVYAIPTDAKIDPFGRLVEVGDHRFPASQ
jgi:thiol-disulfide isomerase/thioredoxin